jgi:hypothetical protein
MLLFYDTGFHNLCSTCLFDVPIYSTELVAVWRGLCCSLDLLAVSYQCKHCQGGASLCGGFARDLYLVLA